MSDLKYSPSDLKYSPSFIKICTNIIKTNKIPDFLMAVLNSREFKTVVSKINISDVLYKSPLLRRYMLSFKIQKTLVRSISEFHRIPCAIENLICSYLDYGDIIETLKKKYPRIEPRKLRF